MTRKINIATRTRQLSRRTVLHGLGAAVALPWLEAMMPSTAQAAAATSLPRRMAWVYIPQGAPMAQWFPTLPAGAALPVGSAPASIKDYTLSPILEPLKDVRDDITLFGGLTCDKARANGDGGGDHARAGGAFLTGAQPKKTAGANFHAGTSADQVAAQKLGDQTRLPSLEMAIEGFRGAGNCDSGYACVYETTLSWKNATTPLPTEINPKNIFNRLFSEENADSKAKRQLRSDVLSAVLEDANALNNKLGGADKQKLDQYLTGVRELEQRIEMASKLPPVVLPEDTVQPVGVPASNMQHIRLMCDLMVLAFQTDVTRISTFMLGKEGSELKYTMVGVTEGHHTISHHQNDATKLAQIKKIGTYHMQQFAYLVSKLKSIPEGDGTLLDNCMICYGSAIADPNAHAHDNLPLIMAGRGGGTINPGRYLRYANNTPLNNLWLSMLDRFGASTPRLGDSTGLLPGLV